MSSISLVYTRYELLRTLRNRRFFFLALAFPLLLYLLIAGANRHVHDIGSTGISAPLYFMVGMASFGTMSAMLSCGARIAAEREAGWNRQLRISPLPTQVYFRTKVLTAYMMAVITLCVLYLAGASYGVSLGAGEWLEMTGLILIGLIPFAALGVLLGHLLTPDSIGPAIGGSIALLALLGGAWGPIAQHGFLNDVAQLLPSYWLVQAAHVGLGGHAWPAKAWVVIVVWTLVAARLATRAYRRDTGRGLGIRVPAMIRGAKALSGALLALCLALALVAAPGAGAAETIHYTSESLPEFEHQLESHQIQTAVFNKKLRSVRLTTKNGEHFLIHYKKNGSKPLEAQLRAKAVAVSVLNEAAANKEAKEAPKHHKIRYIVGGVLLVIIVVVGGVLLYNRQRRLQRD